MTTSTQCSETNPRGDGGDRAGVTVLADGELCLGGSAASFVPGDAKSLVGAYVDLVASVRRSRVDGVIEIRRADIEALADHLGRPPTDVVERLGRAMGAGRRQRAAMTALFTAGAVVIGVVTSIAPSPVAASAPYGIGRTLTQNEVMHQIAAVAVEQPVAEVVPAASVEPEATVQLVVRPASRPAVSASSGVVEVVVDEPTPPAGSSGGSDPAPVVGPDGQVHWVAVGEAPLPPAEPATPPPGSSGGSEPAPVVGPDGEVYWVAVGEVPLPPAERLGTADVASPVVP